MQNVWVWGRTLTSHLGGSNRVAKKLKIERAAGPWISMALLDGGTQQPTKSRPKR